MTLFLWSQTAATNDDVDSTINWQESMAPSAVNNSARAMMAAIAKFRDDISGNLVTAGSATAYTLTSNQTFTSLSDGIFVVARMNATSGTDPTLNVDSLGAKDILLDDTPTNIPSGYLVDGRVYGFVYDSGADGWLVSGIQGGVLTTADNPDLAAIEALAGTDGVLRKTAANTWALDEGTTSITFAKDNNGIAIPTGVAGDIEIPFACTITEATLLVDQTGSIVIDLWKDSYANYPPTDADSITASAPVTISSGVKARDTTLSGWTTSVAAGDIIRVNVDSASTVTRFTLALTVDRYI